MELAPEPSQSEHRTSMRCKFVSSSTLLLVCLPYLGVPGLAGTQTPQPGIHAATQPPPPSQTPPAEITATAVKELAPSPAPQPLVTNSFFETDLRQVLGDLSQATGVPIRWDSTVQGLVTYEAKNQPLEDVLKAVLLPAGFAYKWEDGLYYVGSPKPGDPAFTILSTTEVMTLSSVDASEAVSLLSDNFKPFVKASSKSNVVCISAPPVIAERIRADLAELDQPPVQISLDVLVTEVSADALHKLGLDWWGSRSDGKASWEIGAEHTNITDPSLEGTYTESGVKIGGYPWDVAAKLQALMQTGDAKIRANPRLTTLNGRAAEISLTTDQYFIIATTTSQNYQYNTLQSVSSGIRLQITPYVSSSGTITIYLRPEVGDVIGSGAQGLPEISKRTATTSVRVKDGQTFSIGGLNIEKEKIRRKKIPILGQIPLLGYFFRYDERQKTNTETLIFVTPHVLHG